MELGGVPGIRLILWSHFTDELLVRVDAVNGAWCGSWNLVDIVVLFADELLVRVDAVNGAWCGSWNLVVVLFADEFLVRVVPIISEVMAVVLSVAVRFGHVTILTGFPSLRCCCCLFSFLQSFKFFAQAKQPQLNKKLLIFCNIGLPDVAIFTFTRCITMTVDECRLIVSTLF